MHSLYNILHVSIHIFLVLISTPLHEDLQRSESIDPRILSLGLGSSSQLRVPDALSSAPIFMKLTNPRQHHVQTSYADFHENHKC